MEACLCTREREGGRASNRLLDAARGDGIVQFERASQLGYKVYHTRMISNVQ